MTFAVMCSYGGKMKRLLPVLLLFAGLGLTACPAPNQTPPNGSVTLQGANFPFGTNGHYERSTPGSSILGGIFYLGSPHAAGGSHSDLYVAVDSPTAQGIDWATATSTPIDGDLTIMLSYVRSVTSFTNGTLTLGDPTDTANPLRLVILGESSSPCFVGNGTATISGLSANIQDRQDPVWSVNTGPITAITLSINAHCIQAQQVNGVATLVDTGPFSGTISIG